jgi:Mn-dependent DtxR family transcriptional regulator
MKSPRASDGYAKIKPNPEAGLTAEEKRIRRELLRSERPIATAASLIAGLRAQLAAKEPEP